MPKPNKKLRASTDSVVHLLDIAAIIAGSAGGSLPDGGAALVARIDEAAERVRLLASEDHAGYLTERLSAAILKTIGDWSQSVEGLSPAAKKELSRQVLRQMLSALVEGTSEDQRVPVNTEGKPEGEAELGPPTGLPPEETVNQ